MKKPSRPIAFAALVLACALLPADFFAHRHDDSALDAHEYNCTLCCLRDYCAVAAAVAVPEGVAPLALVSASTRHRHGFRTAPDPHPTRGPPRSASCRRVDPAAPARASAGRPFEPWELAARRPGIRRATAVEV